MREVPARALLTGEHDPDDALVTVRAGAGADATDFAAMVVRMYLRWAERHGHRTEVQETFPSERAGITAATFRVRAPFAFGLLSGEHGTHRFMRISPEHGRRQTSFVEVEVDPVSAPRDADLGSPWGHQIRTYVLAPFRMVKDLRSNHEVDDPTAVLDGDIDGFIDAGIRWRYGRGAPE